MNSNLTRTQKRNRREKLLRQTRRAEYLDRTIYNPTKHKTQADTRKFTEKEIYDYIRFHWISKDFDSSDLVSTLVPQSYSSFDPRLEFFERILKNENRNQIMIPDEYLELLECDIFQNRVYSGSSSDMWKKFGRWMGFEKPNKIRHHCRNLWKKIDNAHKRMKTQEDIKIHVTNALTRHPNDKLFIADETTKKVGNDIHLSGYRYVSEPWYLTNTDDETMIDFFEINFQSAEMARATVDQYYKHNLVNPSHRSNQFNRDMIEHFGCFTDNNNIPYVTSNTASTHSHEHRKCVQDLILGFQSLSDAVNDYFCKMYPALYAKMMKLDLGPNAPKPFSTFPTVSVNFNSICQFHRDLKDHPNTLCVVCPLGSFEGGYLAFPELKLAIMARQGQSIAFRSCHLVHGNFPVMSGTRHSVVFYVYETVIKQNRRFGSLFDDRSLDQYSSKYSPPEFDSRQKLKNHRRSYLDLELA